MIVYTVQKGDSLWKISRHYGVSLDSLVAANPQLADPNYILVGQQINVPELWPPLDGNCGAPAGYQGSTQVSAQGNTQGLIMREDWQAPASMSTPTSTSTSMSMSTPASAYCDGTERPCIYLARQGETLAQIAACFMVPLTHLIYFNLRWGKHEALPQGARIIIPALEAAPEAPMSTNQTMPPGQSMPPGQTMQPRPQQRRRR